jgi:hypothetical protein
MIGMLSFTVPFLGEFSDVIGLLCGYLMTWMYKENSGKNRRVVTFLEDFTLFRFYSNFTNVDLQLPHKKQNAS